MFFTSLPKEIIALAAAGIHLASTKFRTDDLLGLVDWPILVLFMGLFVVAGAFQSTGYGEQAVQWLAHGGFNLNAPGNLTLTTAALSNLIKQFGGGDAVAQGCQSGRSRHAPIFWRWPTALAAA